MTFSIPVDTLDRSRPFSTVHGEDTGGQAFSQRALGIEGWPYDHEGKLMFDKLNEKQLAKYEAKQKEAEARAEAAKNEPPEPDEELDQGEQEDAIERVVKEDPNEDVNLVQWLTGNARYKPFQIQSTIKARFGANKPNMKEAARYLVEEKKLVPWADVTSALRPAKPAAE